MTAYYNEIDPYAAQWLRNLIAAGEIAGDRFWLAAHAASVGRQQRGTESVETWSAGRTTGTCGDVADPAREQLDGSRDERAPRRNEFAECRECHGTGWVLPNFGANFTVPCKCCDGSGARLSQRCAIISDSDKQSTRRSSEPRAQCDWWDVEPDVGRVAHGVPARVAKLRALGNAIVPQAAAEFIRAAL